jgi:hypothetical protein
VLLVGLDEAGIDQALPDNEAEKHVIQKASEMVSAILKTTGKKRTYPI